MTGVDGTLRIAFCGGERSSWEVGREPRRSKVVPPRNDSGPVERRKFANSLVEFSFACARTREGIVRCSPSLPSFCR